MDQGHHVRMQSDTGQSKPQCKRFLRYKICRVEKLQILEFTQKDALVSHYINAISSFLYEIERLSTARYT